MPQIDLSGISLMVEQSAEVGAQHVLYLHPQHHLPTNRPFMDQLNSLGRVICPLHPGFGRAANDAQLRTVDDLAYLYLELIEHLDLTDILLVGSSLGGWVGLEMAVRDCSRIRAMALIAPLGCRFAERDEREFADLSALPEQAVKAHLYAQPDTFAPDYASVDEDELVAIAQEREALARYAWSPYLHNPILPRWLHRVRCPVNIVQGAEDRYVCRRNGSELVRRLPQATLSIVDSAGHYPQVERCQQTFDILARWCESNFAL